MTTTHQRLTPKPKIGTPFRWGKHRLLKVPEVGDKDNQCKGCLREESPDDEGWKVWGALCELRGKNDCQQVGPDGEPIECQSIIFIKDTKASIAEYIARRMGG